MKHLNLIGGVLFLLIVILLIIKNKQNFSPAENHHYMMRLKSLNGIVVNKNIDEHNHNYPIVVIRGADSSKVNLDMSFEKSGIFGLLEKGDSIVKERKNDTVRIYRDDVLFIKSLEY